MAKLRSTAVLALLTWLLPACGGDDTDVPEVVPTVRLTSVIPSVGPRWQEDVAAGNPPPPTFVMPCDGVVAVGASTTDFLERPPGGCGDTQNCGFVKLVSSFDGKEITLGALQTPALFELFGTAENPGIDRTFAGTGSFTATLVHDKGDDYLDLDGNVISRSLETTFDAASGCPMTP